MRRGLRHNATDNRTPSRRATVVRPSPAPTRSADRSAARPAWITQYRHAYARITSVYRGNGEGCSPALHQTACINAGMPIFRAPRVAFPLRCDRSRAKCSRPSSPRFESEGKLRVSRTAEATIRELYKWEFNDFNRYLLVAEINDARSEAVAQCLRYIITQLCTR